MLWIVYATAASLVVWAAALALDRAARWLRFPCRWVWIATLGTMAVLPIIAPMVRQRLADNSTAAAEWGVTLPTILISANLTRQRY